MGNQHLELAKVKKDDEFYTSYADIASEVPHYAPHFKDKTVYCNCDAHETSNFVKYFEDNFETLGLKALFATTYSPPRTYCFMTGEATAGAPAAFYKKTKGAAPVITPLGGGGSFCSKECLSILAKSDIVVTNPPFSMSRKFYATLLSAGKSFLIIGSVGMTSYNDVFYDILANKVWVGHKFGAFTFDRPDGQPPKPVGCCWITNMGLPISKTMPKPVRRYEAGTYGRIHFKHKIKPGTPHILGAGALYVHKIADIPISYPGLMAVPITFLKFYDRGKYVLVGKTRTHCYLGTKELYGRFLIQEKSAYQKKPKKIRIVP